MAFSLIRADGIPLTPIFAVARNANHGVVITAFALRESNASTKILQRLGLAELTIRVAVSQRW